jgi:hypothetical protein
VVQIVRDPALAAGEPGAEVLHLGDDVVLILRQPAGEVQNLRGHHPREQRHQRAPGHDDHDDRRHPPDPPPLQPRDDGGEQEAEQHRQRQRDQHLLREVQRGDDDAHRRQHDEP